MPWLSYYYFARIHDRPILRGSLVWGCFTPGLRGSVGLGSTGDGLAGITGIFGGVAGLLLWWDLGVTVVSVASTIWCLIWIWVRPMGTCSTSMSHSQSHTNPTLHCLSVYSKLVSKYSRSPSPRQLTFYPDSMSLLSIFFVTISMNLYIENSILYSLVLR